MLSSSRCFCSYGSGSADLAEFWKRSGGGFQHGACAQAVVIHLPDQGRDAVEFQLVAQIFDEGDVERLAVEVGVEIEQEDFEQRWAVVEGRPPAIARNPIESLRVAATAESDAHCVNTVPESDMRIEPDVGGRIAEVASALLSVDHGAAHEPRAAQHGSGVANAAFGERGADGTGGNRQSGQIDM